MAKQRRKEKKPQKPKKRDMHEQKKLEHQPLMNAREICNRNQTH